MRFGDERGMMAIGVALMLIVVLALFGGALWQYSMFELRRVQRTEEDMQALFLARAGAEAVMGAWKKRLAEPIGPGSELQYAVPFGQMDTLYFDLERKQFTTTKPDRYLGPIDVEVKEDAIPELDDQLAVIIEAAAKVGATTRTVQLVTYPHLYGHDPSLLWYDRATGAIRVSSYTPVPEPVIMRPAESAGSIYLASQTLADMGSLRESLVFAASDLIFESPLKWMRPRDEGGSRSRRQLVLQARRIFLNGLELSYRRGAEIYIPPLLPFLPPIEITILERNFPIVFSVPDFDPDLSYSWEEIRDRIDWDALGGSSVDTQGRFGEVYFDPSPLTVTLYLWEWSGGLVRYDVNVRLSELEGKAFFFRNGWTLDPKEIWEKGIDAYLASAIGHDLLPISAEAQTARENLEDVRPFYWRQ